MRGACWVMLLTIILPTIQCALPSLPPAPDDGMAAPSSPIISMEGERLGAIDLAESVLIWVVCPAYETEFVTLRNRAPDSIDLTDWKVTDGEGTLTVRGIVIRPDEELTICSNRTSFQRVEPACACLEYPSSNVAVKGRFVLADEGDEVTLLEPNGTAVDLVCYGKSNYVGPGWSGAPASRPGKGSQLERTSLDDMNSSLDWRLSVPGQSEMVPITSDAIVEPFSAPECAVDRIAREMRYAQSEVVIEVYEIDHPIIVQELRNCSRRGVEVRMLVEGSPVGGMKASTINALLVLASAGCHVWTMRSDDGYRRYDYLHCKYAVIDVRRTLIVSENWATGGADANRGWGVSIEDEATARFFRQMFESDCRTQSPDVVVPDLRGEGSLAYLNCSPSAAPILSARATVRPLLSPDFSAAGLVDLIRSATRRILVEEFYIAPTWCDSPGLVRELCTAAERGVSVRVLLDGAWFNSIDTKNNTQVVARLNQMAVERSIDLEARLCSRYHDFALVHNKGLIVDDQVVVSSINWADGPLYRNREVGVVIGSAAVAGYFADLFASDWSPDPAPPTIALPWTEKSVAAGTPVLLDASDCQDNVGIVSFSWDVGPDGAVDSSSVRFVVDLAPGPHQIRLTVSDAANNSATATLRITVLPAPAGADGSLALVPAAIVPSSIVLWRLLRRVKSRMND